MGARRQILAIVLAAVLPGCSAVHKVPGVGPSTVERWCATYQAGYLRLSPFLDALHGYPTAAGPLAALNAVHGRIVSFCGRQGVDEYQADEAIAEGTRALARLLELHEAVTGPAALGDFTARSMDPGRRARDLEGDVVPVVPDVTVDPDSLIRALRRVEAEATSSMARR